MEEIHFSSKVTLDSFCNQKWNIGKSYKVEFFPEKLIPVYLFDTNSDISKPIKEMSKDQIIFSNFEYTQNMQSPPICLFSFCSSTGVYLFKQINSTPNQQLKDFMMKYNRKFFVGYKVGDIFKRFKLLFGDNFYMNFEDAVKTRIPKNEPHDFKKIILKYAGKPCTNITDFKSKWDNPVLTIKQVLYSAFGVYALSLSYPHFPQNKPFIKLTPKGQIKFTKGWISQKIDDKFRIGDSYQVEFFPGIQTQVSLIDANSDIEKYVKIMSQDPVIFADFEHVSFYKDQENLMPINVFAFCCSFGVFIFQQTDIKGNDQLGQFLREKKGQKFYTFGCQPLKSRLRKMFGSSFNIDIEDVYRTRVEKGENEVVDINGFFEKYGIEGVEPLIKKGIVHIKKNSYWSNRILSMQQVLYTAYVVTALSLCFKKFPPIINASKSDEEEEEEEKVFNDDNDYIDDNQTEGEIMDYGQIRFTEETPLSSYEMSNWNLGATAEIEFFPGTFSKVYLLDAVNDLEKFAPLITKDGVVFIDFEYNPLNKKDAAPVCLFQFCSSEGAFLFRQLETNENLAMKKFLSKENGLKFVAKGISGDMNRLKRFFGNDFEMSIEDIGDTRLTSYGESLNFESMVEKFAGKLSEQFKDKKISCSNWNAKKLRKVQVIYSAFDVVALFACYPNFHPPRLISYIAPDESKSEPQNDVKKELINFAVSLKKFDSNDSNDTEKVDAFWNLNAYLVPQMMKLDFNVLKNVVLNILSINYDHKFRCKICRRFSFNYFTSFFKHCQKKHAKNPPTSDDIDMKKLFMIYLHLTGRIYIENLTCYVCNQKFDSDEELCDHCWNENSQLLNEFALCKKKSPNKKEKDEDGEEESGNEDDDYDYNDD